MRLRHFRNRAKYAVALILALSSNAHAIEITDDFSIRGFYTLGAVYSDSDSATIANNFVHAKDEVETIDQGETSTKLSLLGLQADYALSTSLDLTLQVVSSPQTDPAYQPQLSWAYFKYDLGSDTYLRGGRIMLSMLQGIELRHVGFSRLWARPLVPVSGAGGFDIYNGAELLKGVGIGDYNLRFQAAYGQADHHRDFIENRHVGLLSARVERQDSWVSLAALQARYDVDTPPGDHIMDNAELLMGALETELHLGNSITHAGYAYGKAEINPDEELAYLSLGYQLERFTPYLLWTQRRIIFDASELEGNLPPPPPPTDPPPLPPPPIPDGEQKTLSMALGMRYDLGATYAIKAQVEQWQREDSRFRDRGVLEDDGVLFTLLFEGVF